MCHTFYGKQSSIWSTYFSKDFTRKNYRKNVVSVKKKFQKLPNTPSNENGLNSNVLQ